jgi:hypothetical protein
VLGGLCGRCDKGEAALAFGPLGMTQLALVFTIPTTTISARKSKIARQISSTIKFEGAPMIARPSIARLADSVPVALDLSAEQAGLLKDCSGLADA